MRRPRASRRPSRFDSRGGGPEDGRAITGDGSDSGFRPPFSPHDPRLDPSPACDAPSVDSPSVIREQRLDALFKVVSSPTFESAVVGVTGRPFQKKSIVWDVFVAGRSSPANTPTGIQRPGKSLSRGRVASGTRMRAFLVVNDEANEWGQFRISIRFVAVAAWPARPSVSCEPPNRGRGVPRWRLDEAQGWIKAR
jgi:hypothetical protein